MNETNRVVLFATCYVSKIDHLARYRRWLAYYLPRLEKLGNPRVCLVDDGSSLDILNQLNLPIYPPDAKAIKDDVFIIHFSDNLGRPVNDLIAGWWRSFSYMGLFAIRFNLDRLIHIESDTYVLSDKLFERLRTAKTWSAPHFGRFPMYYPAPRAETCIMSIPRREGDDFNLQESEAENFHKNNFGKLYWFYEAGPRFWFRVDMQIFQHVPEYILPSCGLHTLWYDLQGDRYGEDWWDKDIPTDVDYVANVGAVSSAEVYTSMRWKFDNFFTKLGLNDV